MVSLQISIHTPTRPTTDKTHCKTCAGEAIKSVGLCIAPPQSKTHTQNRTTQFDIISKQSPHRSLPMIGLFVVVIVACRMTSGCYRGLITNDICVFISINVNLHAVNLTMATNGLPILINANFRLW